MKRPRIESGDLFGYISPLDGSPCLHPPLCACGTCPMPVERFEAEADRVLRVAREFFYGEVQHAQK